MKGLIIGLLGLVTIPAQSQPLVINRTTQPILMDGRCSDEAYASSTTLTMASRSTLHLLEDERYLYVCIAYPPDSWGAGDLYFIAPEDGAILNLHVSAQKGERKQNADGTWPDYIWENNRDWFGNVVVMRWNQEDGFTCCHPSSARELQISKRKIADTDGRIYMMLTMSVIMTEAGTRDGRLAFPENASLDNRASWADLVVAPVAR